MSGIEGWNYPAFDAVAQALESVGYTVLNPANHFDRDTTRPRADYIRQSLHDVETVDALALLSNWDKSEGARLEFEYARQLGIPAYDWRDLYTLKSANKPATRVTKLPRTLSSVNLTDYWCARNGYLPGDLFGIPSFQYVPSSFVRDPNTPYDMLARSPAPKASDKWVYEREDILRRFRDELAKATGDGSKKRQAGEKPPWYRDDAHEAAIFSHLNKWKHGEKFDADSGAHTLVHLAWRALAIACKETGNIPEGD